MEDTMSNSDTVMLNPQLVGQLEKHHVAILRDKVLAGTSLDQEQWITLQIASSALDGIGRQELVEQVARMAAYDPPTVGSAIAELAKASLVEEGTGADGQLAVTPRGRELVSALRSKARDIVGPVYGSIPPDDLATAGRVVRAITDRLSEVLNRS
jgi:DNA-binding MarR family transcriptional regulator